MTTRMYGGQRSGQNNWYLYNHLPSGVDPSLTGLNCINDQDTDGYDVSGGWDDCGDHVKFGQTQFYSAYMLLKGYAEFPTGYDDYYAYNYQGYAAANDWTYEGTGHAPNGIPDILDEVKHATDYFIKCTRNANTFYYQVGDGNYDHTLWVTGVKLQTEPVANGGETRPVYKNPSGASMASFCGATLALMARMYKTFDPAYANVCLQHAMYAYTYAKAHPGTAGTGEGGFYAPNDNWKDDYATMCAELYWATGTTSYKTEALSFSVGASSGSADIYGKNYGFDYSNNGDIAIYNLALLGKSGAQSVLNQIVNTYYFGNVQSDGQFAGGNTGWGPLRYNANTAFIVALWQKLYGTAATPNKYIYDNIDYIFGKNSLNLSFVVGFGSNCPQHPHQRDIYLRDDNPADAIKNSMVIPTKNQQSGYMCGGSRNPSSFSDDVVNYTYTEGGIDYNACLVGILAYINSVLAPVDTTKFGHPTPNLGSDQSICGVSSITLNAQIKTDGKKTFTWQKDGTTIVNASTTQNTLQVTQAGTYTCILDSAGVWSSQASVNILDTLPVVNLGPDAVLCNPSSDTLNTGVTGSGVTYQWYKNGTLISGATTSSYIVYSAGTYKATVSASGCPSKSDQIVITSNLPAVTNDTLCQAGQAALSISGTGPFDWYKTYTGGSSVYTGNNYKPSVSQTTIYYVQDASSVSVTAGLSSSSGLTNPQNAGSIGLLFTAYEAFTITSVKVLPYVYSCSGNQVSVTFDLMQNGATLASYTGNGGTCTGVQSGAPFNTYYTLNFSTPISVPAAGNYELIPSSGNQLVWFDGGADFTQTNVSGVIDVTGDTRNDKSNSYPAIFDITIQAGSNCARTPVIAAIDPSDPNCGVITGFSNSLSGSSAEVYPNPSSDYFSVMLNAQTQVQINVFDEMGRLMETTSGTSNLEFGSALPTGMYHVVIYSEGQIIKSANIVKR